jgi:formylglycine-generating enzyme required for sulfatase activity
LFSGNKGDKRPIETVSWLDCVKFCHALSEIVGLKPYYLISSEKTDFKINEYSNGYRLPTDAEWEFACKAGHTNPRYGEIDTISWYKQNSMGETHEIGLKEPNDWGLYDMLGNVWEWCSNLYDETVYGSYRIIRGGGWNDDERGCLATNRRRSHPTAYRMDDLGFRIARNLL